MKEETNVMKPAHPLLQQDLEGAAALADLALDISWTWNHAADEIWNQIDCELWDLTHNPWIVLQTASREKLKQLLGDQTFRSQIDLLLKRKADSLKETTWFQQTCKSTPLKAIAYFSMEFMLSEALPIYSGGLGNVAGDQLKAANDLGIPVIGIGLLYQQGYFRQEINKEGEQEALFPYNDPGQLPIRPLRYENGEWLRIEIALPGFSLWLRAWQVQVGRNKLYLLDSNDAANFPIHRGITSELYGGGPELRLKQELVLGIGGWRLLELLNIHPEVCHLNEGHAAFAILERARNCMKATGLTFMEALAVTRAGNLFTTHTAVAAGFDHFSPDLIAKFLTNYAESKLGISLEELLALGRGNAADKSENFNMAYLAVRGSGRVNGVSRLHGEVSRSVFASLFPRWPQGEVPIGYVTNGVHTPSWDSKAADGLWTTKCGKKRWRLETEQLTEDIRCVSDAEIWKFRTETSQQLVEYARKRLSKQLAVAGFSSEAVEKAKHVFDPKTLTLGFARRFATYKRPNLLLTNPQRFYQILTRPDRPVQLILAGKAHPADKEGQALIQQWVRFIRDFKVQQHVIFLSDYDMLLTENLVQGVDVWVNTPRRPWEACGTSGMKVLVNGGINLSELDGWWAEAYSPEVGWALGDGREHHGGPELDVVEAEALYKILEDKVIPKFYTRDANGIPTAWIALMRESMARLTPQFSANRAVREYTENYYIPAAVEYRKRVEDKGEIGKKIVHWQQRIKKQWPSVRFGELKVELKASDYIFKVQVYLGELDPKDVKVEIYSEDSFRNFYRSDMNLVRQIKELSVGYEYEGIVPTDRPAEDYTVRIIPHHEGVAVPLEEVQILWQK